MTSKQLLTSRLNIIGDCIYRGLYARHGLNPKSAPPLAPRRAERLALFVVVFLVIAIALIACGY